MSTNGTNLCEDAGMADCDGEKVVTMMDVLKEQEDFEEDANAVLGASDDKNCTYSKGYVKRQAIYACMTCTDAKNEASNWAGVCLACSLTCHENHELMELYTKRNFRCDCGNPKFKSHPCQFTPNKIELNIENIYNQNFSGVYCICHRPYPDLESSTQGDMIQCIICEDWLHSNHLDAIVPSNEQYCEMICKACMDKNEFLHDYSDLAVNKESMDVDILNISSENNTISNSNGNSNTEVDGKKNITNVNSDDISEDIETGNDTKSESPEEKDSLIENQKSIETADTGVLQTNLSEENKCKLDENPKKEQQNGTQIGATGTTEMTKEYNENTVENQTSLKEGETLPICKAAELDHRSQEQVEEDILLADPTDINLDQKKNSLEVIPSNAIKSSIGELIDGKTSESEPMEISESISEDNIENTESKNDFENGPKSYSVPVTKQSESAATTDEPMDVANVEKSQNIATTAELGNSFTAGESEDVAITDHSENNTIIGQTELAPSTEQFENAPTAEYSESGQNEDENVSNTENAESKNVSSVNKSENGSTERLETVFRNEHSGNVDNELLKQYDKNFVSERVCEKIANEENDSHVKDNSTDTLMNENKPDEPKNNDFRKGNTAISSTCDDKLTEKIEIDILKRKLSSEVEDTENVEIKKPKLEHNNCMRPKRVKKVYHGATFWPSNFRRRLCTCNECISMYKDLSVLFLIDPDDTVTAYEKLGKEKTEGKPASQYEKGMAALSSLGRIQQINALTEYTKLRDKLLDFLKTFKDKKVIVKEEDIKAFFAGMKPVREPDGVYFCR